MLRSQTILVVVLAVAFMLSACVSHPDSKKEAGHPNRLAQASSPYLQEHSDNPVDWYEWGTEALEKAKNEGKPLIVSIGYASCHWCHVMERESFMDTTVARLMNENFISIKVDREERPDIDQIYMTAAQLITGSGGWPLSVFALPDGKPFYVATYFPKEEWIKLLGQILSAYKKDHDDLVRRAEALTRGIRKPEVITTAGDPQARYAKKTYDEIFGHWKSQLDFESGGLAGAPKFPMPVAWEFMLQNHYLTGNKKALTIAVTTLDEIAKGGLYDQLGGGFARYSTDSLWKVPHFEKMLYDNGQLISLYSHAYQLTHQEAFADVIHQSLNFIEREMTSPEGGFYSSLNADSEEEEGKFYVWTKKELERLLDKKTAELFMDFYNVMDSGNWEAGKNILYRKMSSQTFARKYSMTEEEWESILGEAKKVTIGQRNRRVHPSVDDKILTSWNALMLNGYVDAYFATGHQDYLATSLKNANFLDHKMVRSDGRLWRNYKDINPSIDAFLDDYALLAKAYIHLYEATFDIHWLERARMIADYAVHHFRDPQSVFFFYTSDDATNLVARGMELTDNVIPASNSVFAEVLFRLGEYYDQESYREMSKSMLNQIASVMDKNGPYYANWASLMGLIAYQPYEVAIVGEDAVEKAKQMQQHYLPTAIFMGGEKENLPLLESKYVKGETIIYVCRNKSCKLPVRDVDKAMEQLK